MANCAFEVDPKGRIVNDTACVRCGYNLRGLVPSQVCPECGVLIRRSAGGSLLKVCDPRWLAHIASGAYWVQNWIQCVFLAGGLSFLGISTVKGIPVAEMLHALGGILGTAGYWLFTSPDPGSTESRQWRTVRNLARYTMVTTCLLIMMENVILLYSPEFAQTATIVHRMTAVLGLASMCAYASTLARRLPDERLAKRTKIFFLAGTLIFFITFVESVAVAFGLEKSRIYVELFVALSQSLSHFLYVGLGIVGHSLAQEFRAQVRLALDEAISVEADPGRA